MREITGSGRAGRQKDRQIKKFAARKAILAISSFLSFSISGCSTNIHDNASWSGRIQFNGEFNLYNTNYRSISDESCISGSLPLSEQIAAANLYEGDTVTVYGSSVAWPSDDLFAHLENGGSLIRNDCGGEYVIFATSISKK